jgi:Cytochrome c
MRRASSITWAVRVLLTTTIIDRYRAASCKRLRLADVFIVLEARDCATYQGWGQHGGPAMFRFIFSTATLCVAIVAFALSQARSQSTSDGQFIFRFDTFGDEQLWTDTLRMQEAIKNVSPRTALSVGLKVDSDALPPALIDAINAGQVNFDDPAVTIQLLKLNAVIGIIGKVVGPDDTLATIGITCALCHSTVDDSVQPGIGKRLDGWPNRSLNVGAIIALSPAIADKTQFQSWGPGKFDPRLQYFDGTNIVPLFPPTLPTVIPPAFGLQGVNFEIFTGDGPISYWNNYVGVTQMGGHGSFCDARIGVCVTQTPDLVTPKLPALLAYQLSLPTPPPPPGSFDPAAAQRGQGVFNARCARCHIPPLLTDVNNASDPNLPLLHAPGEVGMEPAYSARSATKIGYRTTPLRALWQHPPYFHDGSAPSLSAVVNHYDLVLMLGLTDQQKADLVEYLKTL